MNSFTINVINVFRKICFDRAFPKPSALLLCVLFNVVPFQPGHSLANVHFAKHLP